MKNHIYRSSILIYKFVLKLYTKSLLKKGIILIKILKISLISITSLLANEIIIIINIIIKFKDSIIITIS